MNIQKIFKMRIWIYCDASLLTSLIIIYIWYKSVLNFPIALVWHFEVSVYPYPFDGFKSPDIAKHTVNYKSG